MQMRYNFEIAYVFMCAILFQYTLYQYTSAYWLNKSAYEDYLLLIQNWEAGKLPWPEKKYEAEKEELFQT